MSFKSLKRRLFYRFVVWVTRPLLFLLALGWRNVNEGYGHYERADIFSMIKYLRLSFAQNRLRTANTQMAGSVYTDLGEIADKPKWWSKLSVRRHILEQMYENTEHEDYDEDDASALDAQAMDHAFHFAQTLHDYDCPVMFIQHDGEPRFVWQTDSREQVALLFRASGHVNYVFFRKNPDTTMYGYIHLDHVLDLIKSVGLEHVMVIAMENNPPTEQCDECGRVVLTKTEGPMGGLIARCGRRLASLDQCRAEGCNLEKYNDDSVDTQSS